mmetsp:Transcript_49996/g.132902  ORF Transcript_49996/g.132902 Transcript_49996/m.132902 type:complete len:152 (-) Transcript_49996:169-624(-)
MKGIGHRILLFVFGSFSSVHRSLPICEALAAAEEAVSPGASSVAAEINTVASPLDGHHATMAAQCVGQSRSTRPILRRVPGTSPTLPVRGSSAPEGTVSSFASNAAPTIPPGALQCAARRSASKWTQPRKHVTNGAIFAQHSLGECFCKPS